MKPQNPSIKRGSAIRIISDRDAKKEGQKHLF
jgi:hypothetical protein